MKIAFVGALALAALAGSAGATIQEIDNVSVSLTRSMPLGVRATGFADRSTDLYNNTTTFTGQGFIPGGATSTTSSNGTRFIADDCNAIAAGTVDGFAFSVANFNTVVVSARPRVRFYAADGAGGGPGTFISGFSFTPIAFPASAVNTYSTGTLPPTSQFAFPTNFWAAIFFDAQGTTGTLAQINNLGPGIFDPPTVGTSADRDWLSTLSGGAGSLVSNPTGAIRTAPFAGGTPPVNANYGWQFTTPAPSAIALLGLGGIVAGRRRRA